MKILLIVTSSGDTFFCGNCLRDHLYAQALRRAGHDVVIMPLYLPLAGKSLRADTPLFFPATSYYVAQKYFGNRKMPRAVGKILESPLMLRLAALFSGTTSAKGLEQMTLSMITGDNAHFAEQAEKLVDWIAGHGRPDVVHLSTSMLIGVAKAIKSRIDIPVVCSLQDEEVWLDSLEGRFAREAWERIGENAKHVDRFIASSAFYQSVASGKVPAIQEIEVVYPGVDVAAHASPDDPQEPTIGFYYRMNYANGLDILAQSFIRLKKENAVPNLKLKIGGGYTRENTRFVNRIRKTLRPYRQDVIWSDAYSMDEHTVFYKGISVICAPLRFSEAFGLYVCEAFAAGRPAVVPDTGSFREIVGDAGLIYAPNDSTHLAAALREMLTNAPLYERCKTHALRLSRERYDDTVTAERLAGVYRRAIEPGLRN